MTLIGLLRLVCQSLDYGGGGTMGGALCLLINHSDWLAWIGLRTTKEH